MAVRLQAFGIALDSQKNLKIAGGKGGNIETDTSAVKILVIPTDEELSIAEQTVDVLQGL